ncbi:hypothetical protein LR48_Vigan09g140400 [Vigna angularis]|uniref:Uncharacterized protein n=1 Tax=Phaseolus angularis TaxID=3914 RepID=A0A0L9VCE9_PHAAN|nr:hypothetical protein LR48_Vigan09g140400 [Vigna angularis]
MAMVVEGAWDDDDCDSKMGSWWSRGGATWWLMSEVVTDVRSASFGCQHREENAHPTASQDARPARSAEDARPASGRSSRERRSLAQLAENARTDACRPEGTLIQRAADARQARRGGSSSKWTLDQQVDARPESGDRSPS